MHSFKTIFEETHSFLSTTLGATGKFVETLVSVLRESVGSSGSAQGSKGRDTDIGWQCGSRWCLPSVAHSYLRGLVRGPSWIPSHRLPHLPWSGRALTWISLCFLDAPDLGIHQVVISRIHCGRGDDSSLQPRAHVLDSSKLLSSSSVSDTVPGVSFSSWVWLSLGKLLNLPSHLGSSLGPWAT